MDAYAAATAGRLAAGMDASLVIVHSRSHAPTAGRATGWRLYDAARRVTREAINAGGPRLEVSPVARDGRAVEQLISAAGPTTAPGGICTVAPIVGEPCEVDA